MTNSVDSYVVNNGVHPEPWTPAPDMGEHTGLRLVTEGSAVRG